MSRVKRFELIVNLAEQELESVAQQLATMKQQYRALEQQIEDLRRYMQDYLESLTAQGSNLMPIQLQTTQAFTEKMRQAIKSQEFKLATMEPAMEKVEDLWIEKRARVKALEKVLDKIKKDVQVALDKSEQRMLDDLAAQNFLKESSRLN